MQSRRGRRAALRLPFASPSAVSTWAYDGHQGRHRAGVGVDARRTRSRRATVERAACSSLGRDGTPRATGLLAGALAHRPRRTDEPAHRAGIRGRRGQRPAPRRPPARAPLAVSSVSVVVPVKDGARHLEELLPAIAGQRIDADVEILVIDSGSTDGSPALARSLGATVIEIEPAEFGHGRTRNLAAFEATGDRIVFLTQDATPIGDGWLDRARRAARCRGAGRPLIRAAPAPAGHEPDDRPRADRVLRDVRHGRRAPR